MDDDPRPFSKRLRRTLYCGHCLKHVSKSTYYRHREQYYDEVKQQWLTDALAAQCSGGSIDSHRTNENESECKLTLHPIVPTGVSHHVAWLQHCATVGRSLTCMLQLENLFNRPSALGVVVRGHGFLSAMLVYTYAT